VAKGIVRWSNVPVSKQGFQRWPMVTGRPAFWPALINEMDAWAPPAQVTAPSKALHRPIVENGSPSDSPALMHIDAVGLHVAKRPKKFAPLGGSRPHRCQRDQEAKLLQIFLSLRRGPFNSVPKATKSDLKRLSTSPCAKRKTHLDQIRSR
jgi:hypothetical protein